MQNPKILVGSQTGLKLLLSLIVGGAASLGSLISENSLPPPDSLYRFPIDVARPACSALRALIISMVSSGAALFAFRLSLLVAARAKFVSFAVRRLQGPGCRDLSVGGAPLSRCELAEATVEWIGWFFVRRESRPASLPWPAMPSVRCLEVAERVPQIRASGNTQEILRKRKKEIFREKCRGGPSLFRTCLNGFP